MGMARAEPMRRVLGGIGSFRSLTDPAHPHSASSLREEGLGTKLQLQFSGMGVPTPAWTKLQVVPLGTKQP